MRTITVYIDPEKKEEFYHVADQLMMNFPCFVDSTPVEMDWEEVTIKCRQEDAAEIERRIADFM